MHSFISGVNCFAFDHFGCLSPIVLGFPSFFSVPSVLSRGEVQVGTGIPAGSILLPDIPESRVGCFRAFHIGRIVCPWKARLHVVFLWCLACLLLRVPGDDSRESFRTVPFWDLLSLWTDDTHPMWICSPCFFSTWNSTHFALLFWVLCEMRSTLVCLMHFGLLRDFPDCSQFVRSCIASRENVPEQKTVWKTKIEIHLLASHTKLWLRKTHQSSPSRIIFNTLGALQLRFYLSGSLT